MNLPDFFQDAKKLAGGAAGPKVLIERKSDDGTYAVDSRFGYNKQGLLAINPGASLDYEAERGADGRPDGLIELRITITDADGDTAELLVNIQLTNVNEAPEGIIALMVGVDDSGTPDDDRTPYDPTGPRLPTGTIFSINKKSLRDPDDPERDNLTYTYRWVLLGTQSEDDVFTDETFTPRKVGGVPYPGREDGHNRRVDVTASDGVNSVTKSLYFHVYKKTQIDRSEHAINENETATSPLATIDFDVPGGGRISGVYKIISVNGIDMTPSWAQSPFEIRNYGELWLKSDYRLDHEANSSYEIVLRHYPISGSPYADVTFTLNVNDVNEAPIVQMRGAYAFDFTRDSRDVLQRIAIYDPDNSQDLDQSELTTLTLELTDTRFTLEEYTPDFINTFVPLGLVGKHYNLKINDDASFNTNGETVKLTITAYEGENRDTGKSGTLTLTIHIQPATSGQSSGQGGGVAMTEVVNVDFLPDAGGEDLGMVQNDFL